MSDSRRYALSSNTIPELCVIAKKRGLKRYSNLRKSALVDMILEDMKNDGR